MKPTRKLVILLAGLCGCIRIGYDPLPLAIDASRDAGMQQVRDAGSVGAGPMADANVADSSFANDSGVNHDASQLSGADSGSLDAGNGSVDDVDSGVPEGCPGPTNACGGCSTLAAAIGGSCGDCELGEYACNGTDAITCAGGTTHPTTAGGGLLIDDFEDGDNLFRSGLLHGYWYLVSDPSAGMLSPATDGELGSAGPGAAGSTHALHVWGSGFTQWGAGVQAALNLSGCFVDAAAQKGLGFNARGTGTLILAVATKQTLPAEQGGTCTKNCNDHFMATVTLTDAWEPYSFLWSAFQQSGWGTPATFKPSEAKYLQFSFAAEASLDLYLDNVRFD